MSLLSSLTVPPKTMYLAIDGQIVTHHRYLLLRGFPTEISCHADEGSPVWLIWLVNGEPSPRSSTTYDFNCTSKGMCSSYALLSYQMNQDVEEIQCKGRLNGTDYVSISNITVYRYDWESLGYGKKH